jgi:hypothetical protein
VRKHVTCQFAVERQCSVPARKNGSGWESQMPQRYRARALLQRGHSPGLLWLALALSCTALVACTSDDKPSSLVTSNGGSGGGSSSNGGRGGSSGASTAAAGEDDVGASGETAAGGAAPTPMAQFPSELEADVGCNMVAPDANLLIRNVGDEPLEITSASADSGYTVKTTLPLEIAPSAGATLVIAPPLPSADSDAGMLTGKLTFTTNEPSANTHEVTLTSTIFEGSFEFTDSNGTPITTLTLAYDQGGACPDLTKFRLHNTGNVTFTVAGPTFPDHFAGSELSTGGQAITPDNYAELMVGAVSAPGDACAATGDLTFSVMGAFCGTAPALHVVWQKSPDPDAGASCACTAPTP